MSIESAIKDCIDYHRKITYRFIAALIFILFIFEIGLYLTTRMPALV